MIVHFIPKMEHTVRPEICFGVMNVSLIFKVEIKDQDQWDLLLETIDETHILDMFLRFIDFINYLRRLLFEG